VPEKQHLHVGKPANGQMCASGALHMPGRCTGGHVVSGYVTTMDSVSVGRFDQKLVAQWLFPSLSS
jgi:hypothetical protein